MPATRFPAHPRSSKPQDSLTESEAAWAAQFDLRPLHEPRDSHIEARGLVTNDEALSTRPPVGSATACKATVDPQAALTEAKHPPDEYQPFPLKGVAPTSPAPKLQTSTSEGKAPPRLPPRSRASSGSHILHTCQAPTTSRRTLSWSPPPSPQASATEAEAPSFMFRASTTDEGTPSPRIRSQASVNEGKTPPSTPQFPENAGETPLPPPSKPQVAEGECTPQSQASKSDGKARHPRPLPPHVSQRAKGEVTPSPPPSQASSANGKAQNPHPPPLNKSQGADGEGAPSPPPSQDSKTHGKAQHPHSSPPHRSQEREGITSLPPFQASMMDEKASHSPPPPSNGSQVVEDESTLSPPLSQASMTDEKASHTPPPPSHGSQVVEDESTLSPPLSQASKTEGNAYLPQHHDFSTSDPSSSTETSPLLNPQPVTHKHKSRSSKKIFPIFKTDVILLITGLVGSGRSTFINSLLPQSAPKMTVGENWSLSVCTKEVQHSIVELKDVPQCRRGYRLILVDTPGFNDPDKSDVVVLQEILKWLGQSFPKGKYRGGVIYLHDLTDPRYQGVGQSDLKTLDGVQNGGWYSQLAIVTTKWNRLDSEEGQQRHRLLSEHWARAFKGGGPEIEKYTKVEDAWEVVGKFLPRLESNEIDIRKEVTGINRRRFQKSALSKVMRMLNGLAGIKRRR